jgi:hypothetical protein
MLDCGTRIPVAARFCRDPATSLGRLLREIPASLRQTERLFATEDYVSWLRAGNEYWRAAY